MKIDWDRRKCARRGHVTYAPDEPLLRERLRADTGFGEAWRCLRCGDFALGDPQGSGPAEAAPLVQRGKVLRDLFVLRFLAIERGLRGVFIVLAAAAVWKFSNSQGAVHRLFNEYLDVFRPVFRHFHYDLDHSPVVDTIQRTFGYKHSTLILVAAALLADGELVEPVLLRSAGAPAHFDLGQTGNAFDMRVRGCELQRKRLETGGIDVEIALRGELAVVRRGRDGSQRSEKQQGQEHAAH